MFFVSIGTIWLSKTQREGRGTHRTSCDTTVNIHTRCGDGIISQETTAERFMIYCAASQFVPRAFSSSYFPTSTARLVEFILKKNSNPSLKEPPPPKKRPRTRTEWIMKLKKKASSVTDIIVISLQSARKFDLYLHMSSPAASSRL